MTGLDPCGDIPSPVRYAVAKCVANVAVNEVTEAGSNDLLRTNDDEPRIRLTRREQTIRYRSDIGLQRVDPDLLNLVAKVPVVHNAHGDVVGFDQNTKIPAASFGLEVWSRLVGDPCDPTGARRWGYTVFPFLKGGLISGFAFDAGAVTFNLVGAQTRRSVRWGVGPYDLEGSFERMYTPVSGNTAFRQFITTAQPPEPTTGAVEFYDEIDGGDPFTTTPDEVDGGDPFTAGPWEIDGGWA